jgi:hypothetical protein
MLRSAKVRPTLRCFLGELAKARSFRCAVFESDPREEEDCPFAGRVWRRCAIMALCAAAVLLPSANVVLDIAAVTAALGMIQPPRLRRKRGALFDALGAMVFDILVAGSRNDVTVFLVALMTVFAALAGLMQVGRAWALALAQRGAMFATSMRGLRRSFHSHDHASSLGRIVINHLLFSDLKQNRLSSSSENQHAGCGKRICKLLRNYLGAQSTI